MYTREQAENIRADAIRPLVTAAFNNRKKVSDVQSGVYILLKNCETVYVGQAKRVLKRIATHVGRFDFDEYAVIPLEPSRLLEVESIVIQLLRPLHNQRGGERENGELRKLKSFLFPKTPSARKRKMLTKA